ncbi:MAG: M1 family aminopeptidase [Candidatus Cloacimonetes bacterium]|nr:M1 family aminopeptidase [Candidatus Cloacimonadota bacterium]
MKKLAYLLPLLLLAVLATGLGATQPFWSLEPSTRQIERADSLTGFDISKYVINLEIDTQNQFITGMVEAQVTPEWAIDSIEYELEGDSLLVSSVLLNDAPVAFTHIDGVISIPLPPAQRNPFVTKVYYSGVPNRSPAPYNIGLIFTPAAIYTLSNPDAGRYYWPCYDHPWDKALVDWNITVRADWLAAANGIRSGITDNGDGTRTHHWVSSSPIATYVMGFAAAPYIEFLQQAGTLPIQNFVLPGQLNNAQVDFANVPAMIDFFSSVYGPYPFEKYGHMVVPMTTYAAMEHQTMTTFGAAYLTGNQNHESIVAHELTHQWYGNLVTPITMREVWLKESFATYSEFLWEAHHSGWQAGCDYLRDNIQQYYISWANSNGPQTIFDPAYNMMFAPPTYEKSASVLHMLRLKLGNDAYFNFIRTILTSFPGGNINTTEFIDLAESAAGEDLTQFFQQWIYSPGIPDANFTVLHNDAGMAKIIGTTVSPTSTLFDIDVPISVPGSAVADSVVIRATPDGYLSYFPIALSDDMSSIQIDPNHWVLTRSFSQNTMQLATCLAYDGAVDLSWNSFGGGIPLAGYHVFRRSFPDGEFIRVTDAPLNALNYTDSSVTNGYPYEYYVTAVDTEGFRSLPSNRLVATPIDFPFDQGFLLVDETRHGNGANISPTDQMVDDFYAWVLGDFSYTVRDLESQDPLSLSQLSHHPFILWHCDDFTDMQIINYQNQLGSYVLSGGTLLISGWKYPSQFDSAFLNRFLPGITPALNNSAVLVSAQSDVYPDLHPDPAKLAAPWNGMLPMSYVFTGAVDPLYRAEILNGGENDNEPLAIRVQAGGTMVLLGFPLYFMLAGEARDFVAQVVPELYPAVEVEESLAPALELALSCSPNPFAGSLQISCRSAKAGDEVEINIYNLRGQKITGFSGNAGSKGFCQFVWDGRDRTGRFVGNGVYLLEMLASGERKTMKSIRLR